MVLEFENSHGMKRKIADVSSEAEALKEIKKFLNKNKFKSYYIRSWNTDPYHKVFDVGSWSEFFHLVTPCVLVQSRYNGRYKRFALTPEEFEGRYRKTWPDMPEPSNTDKEHILHPLGSIWYRLTEVGSTEWCNFFTDMTWGLSQSDIIEGNIASVKKEEFGTLKNIWSEFDKGL